MTRRDGKGREDKGRKRPKRTLATHKDMLDWTDREVQGSNESSGACLDRAVVGWSGRSIGRAAGIGFGVVSGVHGSRSLRKWFEYRSEFRRSRRICPSRVDERL